MIIIYLDVHDNLSQITQYHSYEPAPSHMAMYNFEPFTNKNHQNIILFHLLKNKVLTDRFYRHKYPTNYIDCVNIPFIWSVFGNIM